jgi:hypothetical protein
VLSMLDADVCSGGYTQQRVRLAPTLSRNREPFRTPTDVRREQTRVLITVTCVTFDLRTLTKKTA